MGSQKSSKKSCDFFAELISAYLDDELSAVELLDLAEHLKSCSSCHRVLDSLFTTKKILHQAEPFWTKTSPSKEFLPSIMASLKSESPAQGKAETSSNSPLVSALMSSRFVALAAAGLAIMMLFFGTALYFGKYRQTMVATTQKKAVEKSDFQYHVAKTDPEEDLEEYIRDHTLGYSDNLLIDYESPVEFVSYVSP